MRVCVPIEHRFYRTPDGNIWTAAVCEYAFWTRYMSVFDEVRVIARVKDVPREEAKWRRSDGPSVSFTPVPYYVGPVQYLLRAVSVRAAVRSGVGPRDAVLMRAPSQLATCLVPRLLEAGHPFGMEVVGDPAGVFAPGVIKHPLRPFFRWWFTRSLRRQCEVACGVAYVTKSALQRLYPCRALALDMSDVELQDEAFTRLGPFTTHYSSIALSDRDAVANPRRVSRCPGAFRLVTIGSLEQLYKGTDLLIRAVADCARRGLNLHLVVVGEGKYRPVLHRLAGTLGVSRQIEFMGQLPAGAAVRSVLDRCDLFVLPSRTEGLPRAMVEAMARALPCVGSSVGGIPELLDAEDLVPVGNVHALADKIREVLTNCDRLTEMSARNLRTAREYHQQILSRRQREFFLHIRKTTESWIQRCQSQDEAAPCPRL